MRKALGRIGRRLRRPSYADVVATLALFIALGGASYAAIKLPRNSVGAKQLKKNAVTSKKVKDRSLLAKDFKKGQLPRGKTGARGADGKDGMPGADGAPGAQGEQGPTGPSSTAAVMGRFRTVSAVAVELRFTAPSGMSDPVTDPSAVAMRSPSVPVTISNLQVWISASPGQDNTRTFAVLADGTEVATCSVSELGESCSDPGEAVIAANSELVFSNIDEGWTPGGPIGLPLSPPADVQFGYTLGP